MSAPFFSLIVVVVAMNHQGRWMWLQHQSKRQLRPEQADSKRNATLIVSWHNPIDWLRHAGACSDVP
jgi:hypothetical protein